MILRCLAPRDLARLRDLARREGTTADTLARIAVRQLLQASDEWDGAERRRQERRMDLETVTAKVTHETPRPRNRMGGPPWSPETRARYTATIAANRAARAPVGQPTDRACTTPECVGRVPLRFKGQGPQRRDCDACRALRTTGRRRGQSESQAPPLCACGRPAAPRTTGRRPTLCPTCKARRAQDRWRANKRKARGHDLDAAAARVPHAPDDGVEPDDDEDADEDIEALLDTTYPADLVERRAKSPARRRATDRPPRETVQPEGSWWMQAATEDGFTALAESRMAEMAKGKGAKIASQMESAGREP